MAAPSILSGSGYESTTSSTAATSIVLSTPPNISDNDYLFAFVTANGTLSSAPSGWISISSSSALTVYYTYIPIAATEIGNTYTWTFGTSGITTGQLYTVRGANTGTFVDATGIWQNGFDTSTQLNASTITTTSFDTLVIGCLQYGASITPTVTPPGAMALVGNLSSSTRRVAVYAAPQNQKAFVPGGNGYYTFSSAPSGGTNLTFSVKGPDLFMPAAPWYRA